MQHRIITPDQLLHLTEESRRPLRLRDNRDALPGGMSASMTPMLIDWEESEIGRPDGFVVVRNVNYGGNPLEGTTVLQSVKVPLDGVDHVEWVLVPLGSGGKRALVHHGQLRLVFREDRPVELLDVTREEAGGDIVLHDLVFSWEAWREPGVGYDVIAGMDSKAYRLGLRVFAGPQRFLEDALAKHDWFATPLRLPGGAEGTAELLKVLLALGDGVSRHTISEMFEESAEQWLTHAPAADRAELAAKWHALQTLAGPHKVTDDPRLSLPPEERTYQTVVRSCATIAHYCLVVAVQRLAERGLDDGVVREHLEMVDLGGDQAWMAEVARADLGGIFMRAPMALRWLRANPQAMPEKIPGQLDKAGLVVHKDGEPVHTHYSAGGLLPWDSLGLATVIDHD